MARKCTASINLSAIKENYLYAKSLAPNSKAIAIIKADAYGHGAIEVANELNEVADAYGVACIEEAIELINSGIDNTPILLLEGVFEKSELILAEKYSLIVTVCNLIQLQWLLDANLNEPFDVFVKYDSGMGRLGFQDDSFIQAINFLEKSNNIGEITLMTHFSSADDLGSTLTTKQISNFDNTLNTEKYPCSLANSAAILKWSESHREYIRPGIMLYGSSPFLDKIPPNKLTPVMTLSSILISIKSFKAGQSIGYGSRYTCKQDMQIGVVAIGYADGYPRSAEDGTPVFINGVKSKISGRVSMDMITIDLTGVPNPQIGDRVELFGENVSVDEVAKYCNTISYEIFTKITKRVYKSYV
ncbi:alanine racemase [Candidatus Thioglobus sp.]|nr:alanine racemase [Candidatus Thioglobus sp.]